MINIEKTTLNAFDCLYEESELVVYGAPFDGTTSFRPGTRFGPAYIRNDFLGLETYSPYLDMDLREFKLHDSGNVYIPIGNTEKALDNIYDTAKKIVEDGKVPFLLGGEHLVTYPAFRAVYEKYPDIYLLHFDAHTDLRDFFFGEKLSHATVIKRCWDLLGDGRIYQFGIRSGEKSEFAWSDSHTIMERYTISTIKEVVEVLKNKNVYITIDLDVLDPAVVPGTGTPEPGGVGFKELMEAIHMLKDVNIVGMDIVELSPQYDTTGASTAVACKLLRELTLTALKK
ncbi:MAG: agmatinase [Eubacteriales bacterium]|nr:agmatinase [Eubacteriales bacterium]